MEAAGLDIGWLLVILGIFIVLVFVRTFLHTVRKVTVDTGYRMEQGHRRLHSPAECAWRGLVFYSTAFVVPAAEPCEYFFSQRGREDDSPILVRAPDVCGAWLSFMGIDDDTDILDARRITAHYKAHGWYCFHFTQGENRGTAN